MWTHEASIETSAAPARIWALFAATDGWKDWNAGVMAIRLHGPFQAGTRFTMQLPDDDAIDSMLVEVEPGHGFTDETVIDDTRVSVAHRIEPLPAGGSRVVFRTQATGPDAQDLGRMASSDFANVLAALKRIAEQH